MGKKPTLMELISNAPWREAVTYRETWPHEYVLLKNDSQRELFATMLPRFKDGEGVSGRFFNSRPTYLFLGGVQVLVRSSAGGSWIRLEKESTY